MERPVPGNLFCLRKMCVYTRMKDLHTVLVLEPGATYISVQVCTVAVVLGFDFFDFTLKPTRSSYWCPYSVHRHFTLPS
jgi:hypothetical protein